MKSSRLSLFLAGFVAATGLNHLSAQTTYFSDTFTGSNGTDITTTTPATGTYAVVGTNNATNLTIQNNSLSVAAASSADDVAAVFTTSVSDATVYVGFDFSAATAPSADGYFAGFRFSGTNYPIRLFADNTGSGTFTLGLGTGTSPTVSWASNLSTAQTYRVVFGFTENGAADSASLWINPSSVSSTSITVTSGISAVSVGSFLLRQDTSFGQTVVLDNLVASSDFNTASAIPEPSTYAAIFGALALAGTVWHRRRQRIAT